MITFLTKSFKWIKNRLLNKVKHFGLKEMRRILIQGGVALLVIVIGWEIIEDILFPILFGFLGKNLHPSFYALIPITWVMCLHWLVVPIVWGLWMKLRKQNDGNKISCDHHDH